MNIQNIHKNILSRMTKIPEIILNLSKKFKKGLYQEELNNIRLHYPNYSEIYTNGSKDNNNTGCASTFKNIDSPKNIYIKKHLYSEQN